MDLCLNHNCILSYSIVFGVLKSFVVSQSYFLLCGCGAFRVLYLYKNVHNYTVYNCLGYCVVGVLSSIVTCLMLCCVLHSGVVTITGEGSGSKSMTQGRPGKFNGREVFIENPGGLENDGNLVRVQWSPDRGAEEHGEWGSRGGGGEEHGGWV